MATAASGEDPFGTVVGLLAHLRQQLDTPPPTAARGAAVFCLVVAPGLDPDAGFKIDVGPLGGQQLAAPCAGQQQQPHGIGGAASGSLASAAESRVSSAPVR